MNYFLAKKTYFTNYLGRTEHRIMVLKPANKYIITDNVTILKTFLLTISFVIQQTRKWTIQIFFYYLIYSGVTTAFHKIMQNKEIGFVM